ncbi:hypothetical protein BV20DRAFT_742544 [Pilatotrama ljubarskyi]|nr:hypothetical protein BV20DRAFT_742544 [Pilatotrama ljubarskyi]
MAGKAGRTGNSHTLPSVWLSPTTLHSSLATGSHALALDPSLRTVCSGSPTAWGCQTAVDRSSSSPESEVECLHQICSSRIIRCPAVRPRKISSLRPATNTNCVRGWGGRSVSGPPSKERSRPWREGGPGPTVRARGKLANGRHHGRSVGLIAPGSGRALRDGRRRYFPRPNARKRAASRLATADRHSGRAGSEGGGATERGSADLHIQARSRGRLEGGG